MNNNNGNMISGINNGSTPKNFVQPKIKYQKQYNPSINSFGMVFNVNDNIKFKVNSGRSSPPINNNNSKDNNSNINNVKTAITEMKVTEGNNIKDEYNYNVD